jgi:gliding motility-associated-like protein
VVTGTDGNGCAAKDTVVVNVNPLPIVSAGPDQTICPGGSATLNASGATNYSWTPSTGLSCTSCVSPVASPAATTTYYLTGTTPSGCSDTASVTVFVNPTPSISVAGADSICAGGSAVLTASGASSYAWTPATGLSCTSCASPTASPAATTTYTVTGTSGVGCTATTTFTLTVNALPAVNAGIDTAVCAGGSVVLTASGASSYSWSPATGLSCTTCASPTATPTATTTYIVTGTSDFGCTNTDTVVVTVNPLPVISAGNNMSICPGTSIVLTATGGVSYTWTPSTGLSCSNCASPTASPTSNTTYTVTGTGANGCSDTASVTVSINANPTVHVSGRDTLCAGDSTMLTASGAANYTWTPSKGLSCTSCANPIAKPTVTTTYTIDGSSGAGCNATTTFTVVVNALPDVSAGADVSICDGSSATLNAAGASIYAWTPSSGLSCTACANPTANPSGTTSYILTGTDAHGCLNQDTVVVTVNPLPVISAGNNVSICPGTSTTLTASGATAYSWSPATGLSCTNCASPIASPAATTTYTVTGTDALGCSDTASVMVSINANPSVQVSGRDTLCAGDSTMLTAAGAANYTWTPATGLSCTSCANPVAKPAVTTTYTINGTSGVGCNATTTFTVVVNALPAVNAGPDQVICAGASATLTASGAGTYTWSSAPGLSCSSCASPTVNPNDTTAYIVTGTDAHGCVNRDTTILFVKPLPVVSAGNSVSICPGGSTTLAASGASAYVWTPSTGLSCTTCASPAASPASTTTYTVTGTGANGCSDTASVTVSINPTPSVTVSGNTTLCAGDSTALTATGAASYSWTPATGLSCATCSNPVAKPSSTTTYTVVGTSGVGCTASTTVTVTVNPLPVVSAGADTAICAGSSVNLNASGASSYSWSPATGLSCSTCASPTATPSATTTYVVTGTSAAGCVNTDTVVVSIKPLPVISAGSNQSICPGGSATLTASGGDSYVWNASSSLSCTSCASAIATPSATTTYTVTGTGANGCSATANVTVTVNPLPVVTVSGAISVCAGGTTTLTASGAASYSWSPATGLSCTTCSSPVVTPADTTTYKVTGTSGLGCSDSATVTVFWHPLPVITVDSSQSICAKSSVQLTASGALSYAWSPAAGLSCVTCANPVASPSATTTYIVGGTDGYGCLGTAQTTITVLPLPNVDAGPDRSICKQTSVQLSVTGAVSYEWWPATGLSCTSCDSPVASPLTAMTYVVSGIGANGCSDTDTIMVNIYAQPPVNAGPDQTICAGQSAQLQASGAAFYTWTPVATLSCATCANPKASPDSTITYYLVGRDAHGCVDSDHVEIRVIQRGPVAVSPGGEVCEGGFVELNASGGDNYTWFPAAGLSCDNCANPTANPKESTTYHVSVKQGQCFADTLSTDVIIHPIPTIDAGPDQSMVLGNNVQIKTSGTDIATYKWSPAEGLSCTTCANPVASPARDMTYVVEVASDFGCTARDEMAIKVMCDGSQIWMPNTFTPNADGQNDRFYPHGKGILTVARFRIYDRWGELIFDRSNMPVNDKNAGWDGTYKNQPLKPDVYVWVMDATCTNGERTQTKGDISLVR